MKNTTSKNLSVIIAASLCMASGISQAAGLNTFSNGNVADADDVNHNFTYLDGRIDTISTTPGPKGDPGVAGAAGSAGAPGATGSTGATGPAGSQGIPGVSGSNGLDGANGPAGPQGPAGADGIDGINGTNGSGVTLISWAGFGNNAYNEKVFDVTGTNGKWDTEVRTFDRTSPSPGIGTNLQTRQRTLAGAIIKHEILQYDFDTNGDIAFSERQFFDPANIAVRTSMMSIVPPIVVRNNAMGLGMRWGSASMVTQTFDDGITPDEITFAIDSRSLLAIEDITVNGTAYTGCQKIETIRSAERLGRQFQRISWFCPNGIGLVKAIMVRSDGIGSVVSRVMELDAANSTLAP